MKRILILIATFIATHLAFAQYAEEIYTKYQNKKGVQTSIELAGNDSCSKILILDLSQSSSSIQKQLMNEVDHLTEHGYKIMISNNSKNDCTRIITKSEKEYIKELVIATRDNECNYIVIKCHLPLKDIGSIMNFIPEMINSNIKIKKAKIKIKSKANISAKNIPLILG